jgi:hypothetical protein
MGRCFHTTAEIWGTIIELQLCILGMRTQPTLPDQIDPDYSDQA